MVNIGEILGAHGINGEVRVYPLTEHPDRYRQLEAVTVRRGREQRILNICGARQQKNIFILRFAQVKTRDQAEQLRGWLLTVDYDQVIPLPAGRFYDFQLVGMVVFDVRNNSPLGQIAEVLHLPANAVYRVSSPEGKEYLIPALRQVVREVDVKEKKMYILPLEGLLE